MTQVFAAIACSSAFIGGCLSCVWLQERHAYRQRHRSLQMRSFGAAARSLAGNTSLAGVVVAGLVRFNTAHAHTKAPRGFQLATARGLQATKRRLELAGVGDIPERNALAFRWRLAAFGGLAGALAGSFVGLPAIGVGACAGGLCGYALFAWALAKRSDQRRMQLERHISEAVEVVCLGLRAGLSFERSLALYCQNFPTQLAGELHVAQQTWDAGLLSREEALRRLAATYDSVVFERVVDHIVRSLRFGSPLADGLEEQAVEARRAHHARVQEAVMKAPVKMMIPIGTLILPSMLLLVMGPILLDLVAGL